jgi:ABC-type multidrug transport system ATPase subunit
VLTALLGASGAGKTAAAQAHARTSTGTWNHLLQGPSHCTASPTRRAKSASSWAMCRVIRPDTVRGHLRMLCAAAGVPARRADEVLEVVGIVSLRDERLGSLARGMDRRLGLACALLSDPHTLVLDEPADGLSARERRWLYEHAARTRHPGRHGPVHHRPTPRRPPAAADRVVTLEQGRLVADQDAARLRPHPAAPPRRRPQPARGNRLAALLTKEARTAHRSVEVVREDGNRLSVYGSTCADVGETAFRHDILVHQLADEIGDMGPAGTTLRSEAEVVDEPRVPDTSSTRTAIEPALTHHLPSCRRDSRMRPLAGTLAAIPHCPAAR